MENVNHSETGTVGLWH